MVRQCFANTQFEMNVEEVLDLVVKFYTDELVESEKVQAEPKGKPKFNQRKGFVQNIHRKDYRGV